MRHVNLQNSAVTKTQRLSQRCTFAALTQRTLPTYVSHV
jgi:hypothetical protein